MRKLSHLCDDCIWCDAQAFVDLCGNSKAFQSDGGVATYSDQDDS